MIPAPPRHLTMPDTAEVLYLCLSGVFVLVLLARGVMDLRKNGDAVMLFLLVAGALGSVFEPIVDVNGHMYLPEHGAFQAFTLYDRAMPVFVVTAYAGYFAVLAYVGLRAFEAGITTRRLFQLFGAMVVFNIAFESPAVWLHVYKYYGDQPFDFWGFPLWWGFVNPLSSLIAAAVIFLARDRVAGWRDWMIVPLLFIAAGAANGAAAAPTWLALNSGASDPVKYLAALVTFSIALMMIRFIAALVCSDARVRETAPQAVPSNV